MAVSRKTDVLKGHGFNRAGKDNQINDGFTSPRRILPTSFAADPAGIPALPPQAR